MMSQTNGKEGERIDLLHPPTTDDYTWSETNYFGFHVPEERLNGGIYVWLHSNLRVASSGVFIWRGMKKTTLEAEYFDLRQFLPYPTTDLSDYELANGLRVRILAPMRKYQVDYEDERRQTEVHLLYNAIAPPVRYEKMGHFDQLVKATGAVLLQGKELQVDGFFIRDHSWGPRSEIPAAGPPCTYVTGVFDERFAFHLTAWDDPETGPEWAGVYSLPGGKNLISGFVLDGQSVHRLVKASKKTERGPDGLEPRWIRLDLTDEVGKQYAIQGEVTALLPWHTWPNVLCFMCQVRWECGGRVGWGDIHDILFSEFVQRFTR